MYTVEIHFKTGAMPTTELPSMEQVEAFVETMRGLVQSPEWPAGVECEITEIACWLTAESDANLKGLWQNSRSRGVLVQQELTYFTVDADGRIDPEGQYEYEEGPQ